MAELNPPTWIELRRNALTANIRAVRGWLQPETRLMAVLKANAYGHGLCEIANLLKDKPEVQWLGVARLNEAVALRDQGICLPILVLGYTPQENWTIAARQDISLAIHEEGQLQELQGVSAANLGPGKLKVHLKVDTGMHRLGLPPADVPEIVRYLTRLLDTVDLEGLFTHLHSADAAAHTLALQQVQTFQALVSALQRQGLRPPLCHCANTAAILRWPEAHFDMVRLGGGLYGLNPDSASCRLPPSFAPVLRWKARVAQVRHLEAGRGLGYSQTFRTGRPSLIAVLPVGYGDGLLWPNTRCREVLLGGGRSCLVGRICMDQSFADVTDLGCDAVKVGDVAVLIGDAPKSSQWADVVATQEGTIEYDVTTRLADRIPRLLR